MPPCFTLPLLSLSKVGVSMCVYMYRTPSRNSNAVYRLYFTLFRLPCARAHIDSLRGANQHTSIPLHSMPSATIAIPLSPLSLLIVVSLRSKVDQWADGRVGRVKQGGRVESIP